MLRLVEILEDIYLNIRIDAKVHGDDFKSSDRVKEWYGRFSNVIEDINDDPHVDQAKFVITRENIKNCMVFFTFEPKSYF